MAEAWPFSETEWDAVSEAARCIVNATFAKDTTLHASLTLDLVDVLAELRAQHGEHPALLETEADFSEENSERLSLYRRAVALAEAQEFQTLTIRLSLSQLLLELGRSEDARRELAACEGELSWGDESDRASWSELTAELKQI